MNGIKLLFFILGRGRGEKLLKLCAEHGLGFHVMLRGRGTADSDVLDLLGIGDPEKDAVLISSDGDRANTLIRELSSALGLDKPGAGIAFSIPLSAIASQLSSYSIMAGRPFELEDRKDTGTVRKGDADMKTDHDLILTVVDRGFAGDVMAAAKKAGAGGGTIINARGSGTSEAQKFFGAIIQPEKELVLILTGHEKRDGIMKAICEDAGLSKDARGLCFSLPVDSVKGLGGLKEISPA